MNFQARVAVENGISGGTIAYIRPASGGEGGYAVCSADGRQLAVFPNYNAAFFTARQYNLAPVNVH